MFNKVRVIFVSVVTFFYIYNKSPITTDAITIRSVTVIERRGKIKLFNMRVLLNVYIKCTQAQLKFRHQVTLIYFIYLNIKYSINTGRQIAFQVLQKPAPTPLANL